MLGLELGLELGLGLQLGLGLVNCKIVTIRVTIVKNWLSAKLQSGQLSTPIG
jgi:hypothetical protein